MNLMNTCPRLRAIQISSSYKKNLSKATKFILIIQGVELIEGDVWGHRKDIDEYFVIDEGLIKEIRDLTSSGIGVDEIVTNITRRSKLSSDMIRYIARQKMII